MPLDPTVGGPESNSYVTLEEMKSYVVERIPQVAWLADMIAGNLDDNLTAVLIQSARLLDSAFYWQGTIAYAGQRRSHPRIGLYDRTGQVVDIAANPIEAKEAQMELAIELMNGNLFLTLKQQQQNVKKVKAGSAEVEFFDWKDIGKTFTLPSNVLMLIPENWYTEAVEAMYPYVRTM